MLAEERFALILNLLAEKRTATVQELCEALNASESTIRRDLTELARQGRLNKVHGGATLPDGQFLADEPTIGLHPLDVRTLLGVFRTLIANGATVVVIEHDLDVIRSADYIIDMGPGGGEEGGRIVAAGTPAQIKATPESRTGRYI